MKDDIVLKENNPKAIDNFVIHVPSTFNIAFLDLHQDKGHQYVLDNNAYVNKFSSDF